MTQARLHPRSECRRADHLDTDASTVLRMLNIARTRDPTVNEDRMLWRAASAALGRAEPVARIVKRRIRGPGAPIELLLYYPIARSIPAPALLWFHGGGFVIGEPATADTICRHLARASGAVVVSVRYRLVPEHDLYASREDCLAALDWIVSNGPELGIDPSRLAVGGDSAGGNLAAAIAQRTVERGTPPLRLQVLVYPATNLRDDFASKRENASGYLLTAQIVDANKTLLRRHAPDLGDPWLSPALAQDLRGLPPAIIVSAGYDPIRDDGIVYGERLRDAGVAVEHLHYAGQFHGFMNFTGVLRAARDGLDRIAASLRRAFEDSALATSQAPDVTLELAARQQAVASSQAIDAGESVLLAWLILIERLETWRGAVWRSWLPGGAYVHTLSESPLLNPASVWRARLAERHAPIEARETYRRMTTGLA